MAASKAEWIEDQFIERLRKTQSREGVEGIFTAIEETKIARKHRLLQREALRASKRVGIPVDTEWNRSVTAHIESERRHNIKRTYRVRKKLGLPAKHPVLRSSAPGC